MYDRILTEARTSIWLIRADKLDAIFALLDSRATGVQADAGTLATFAADNRARSASRVSRKVGVLPILGTIVQRGNMVTEASGGASTDVIGRQFSDLLASEAVGSIVLEIDSPGGTVHGVPELADTIQAARGGSKPIVAAVNSEACSAAYWLASAADEIVITPSGATGSIGAYAMHVDRSGLNERMGVKPRYVSYGRYKAEGNPDTPLDDEAAAELQRRVDHYGVMFETAIAKNRGVSLSTVRSDWGQGRVLDADQAVAVGMADRVETFGHLLARLESERPRVRRRVAHAQRILEIG